MLGCEDMGPRRRSIQGDFDLVADLLRHGRSQLEIAEALGIAQASVHRRIEGLRRSLTQTTGNAAWLNANPVEVGRKWHGESVLDAALNSE